MTDDQKFRKLARPIIIAVYGPTCAGKTTICDAIVSRCKTFVQKLITTTTRVPRPNEKDGVDYNFVSEGEFLKHKDRYILKTEFCGNRYGLDKGSILKAYVNNCISILILDQQGIKELDAISEKLNYKVFYVNITASLNVLQTRLANRNDTNAIIRLEHARHEQIFDCDLKIVNDDYLETAKDKFLQFVKQIIMLTPRVTYQPVSIITG